MGTLYVCGTPIGNLEDITLRALRVLQEVQLIAAEDTRQTRKLLSHYQIHTPLVSYHEHNEEEASDQILSRLRGGLSVALVSDAGMPVVSDPGQRLIRKAIDAGLRIEVVPGASAVTAALAVSGQEAARWCFEGFLPRRAAERRGRLAELATEERTLVFYEAPHRLVKLLGDMLEILGNRPVSVARELTKLHEEVFRLDLASALEHFQRTPPRGEITLVVSGRAAEATPGGLSAPVPATAASAAAASEADHVAVTVAIRGLQEEGLGTTAIAKEITRRFGIPKNAAYRRVLDLVQSQRGSP